MENKDKVYKLMDLIDYVRNNNIFYQNLYSQVKFPIQSLEELPILKRKDIRKNTEAIISKDYDIAKLKYDKTNGTTEQIPLGIYKTSSELISLDLALWGKRRQINSIAAQNYAFYYYNGNDFSVEYKLHKSKSRIAIQFPMKKQCEEQFAKDIQLMKDNNIKWLITAPSIIFTLCCISIKYGIEWEFDVVESISEYLPSYYKQFFEKVFKCKVLIHYSCHEVWGMAFTNKDNKLEIMDEVIIESQKDERFKNNYGKCLVTNLKLKSMPFIRYEISDLIKIENNHLKTYGFRWTEQVELPDVTIHCSFWDNLLFYYKVRNLRPLEDYQITYKNDLITINVLNFSNDECDLLKAYISKAVFDEFKKDIRIQVLSVNRFYVDNISGKMRGIMRDEDIDREGWEFSMFDECCLQYMKSVNII